MPKPHERRAASAGNNAKYPYYKLACYDERSMVWRDGRTAYKSYEDAAAQAKWRGKGRYRISVVTENGREDREPFTIA